jgi:hypothetical protein
VEANGKESTLGLDPIIKELERRYPHLHQNREKFVKMHHHPKAMDFKDHVHLEVA